MELAEHMFNHHFNLNNQLGDLRNVGKSKRVQRSSNSFLCLLDGKVMVREQQGAWKFDLTCSGFVQVNHEVALGAAI
ncbi:hypothetical protein R6Q59_011008 [Mikania micrantha]